MFYRLTQCPGTGEVFEEAARLLLAVQHSSALACLGRLIPLALHFDTLVELLLRSLPLAPGEAIEGLSALWRLCPENFAPFVGDFTRLLKLALQGGETVQAVDAVEAIGQHASHWQPGDLRDFIPPLVAFARHSPFDEQTLQEPDLEFVAALPPLQPAAWIALCRIVAVVPALVGELPLAELVESLAQAVLESTRCGFLLGLDEILAALEPAGLAEVVPFVTALTGDQSDDTRASAFDTLAHLLWVDAPGCVEQAEEALLGALEEVTLSENVRTGIVTCCLALVARQPGAAGELWESAARQEIPELKLRVFGACAEAVDPGRLSVALEAVLQSPQVQPAGYALVRTLARVAPAVVQGQAGRVLALLSSGLAGVVGRRHGQDFARAVGGHAAAALAALAKLIPIPPDVAAVGLEFVPGEDPELNPELLRWLLSVLENAQGIEPAPIAAAFARILGPTEIPGVEPEHLRQVAQIFFIVARRSPAVAALTRGQIPERLAEWEARLGS